MSRDALTVPPPAAAMALGWHGKLPCRGDFVTGGAPLRLTEGWRAWAAPGLAAVRAGGGPAQDAFLTAPLWRFAAGPGAFGPDTPAALGVMGPGCDASARLHPFLIAAEGAADPARDPAAALADPWFDRIEAAFLAALAPGFDLSALPAALGPAPGRPAALPAGHLALAADPRRIDRRSPADLALFATLFGPTALHAAPETPDAESAA